MRRGSPLHAAAASAFSTSPGRVPLGDATPRRVRVRRSWLAAVVAFPAFIGAAALAVASTRSTPVSGGDGAVPLGYGCLFLAAALLLLGLASRLTVDDVFVEVRFFGLRASRVRFDELVSATFSMVFPSISFAITLAERNGRSVLVHANWWQQEDELLVRIARGLCDHDVAMDRATARIVSRALGVRRPKAEIVHRGRIDKRRTW